MGRKAVIEFSGGSDLIFRMSQFVRCPRKGRRLGRNPKTGIEVPISPRRVVVFKPSAIMKQQLNQQLIGQ
jgi:nucleoid DNA-binding protein